MSWEAIHGHFDFQDIYDEAIQTARPGEAIVEIGVMFGRSLAYLVEGAGRAIPEVEIVGVDPWIVDEKRGINVEGWGGAEYTDRIRSAGGPFTFMLSQLLVHSPATLERARLLRLTSVEAARLFVSRSDETRMQDHEVIAGPSTVRLAFIDGDHRFEAVTADINAWFPKIAPGGVLAGHDWPNYESVRAAVRARFPESKIELSRSSWRVRIPE